MEYCAVGRNTCRLWKENMIIRMFYVVWRKRIENRKVIKVSGWRSALLETKSGDRQRIAFMFRFGRKTI